MSAATAKLPKTERNTSEYPVHQKPDVVMPGLDQAFERDSDVILVDPEQLHKTQLENLAFDNEPIEIYITPSAEKNAPKCYDCWVNGDGAEVFDPGLNKWVRWSALPVGRLIITRRKYVEALMMSKTDSITTVHENAFQVDEPTNRIERSTSTRANVSVRNDRNPKGEEWLRRITYR